MKRNIGFRILLFVTALCLFPLSVPAPARAEAEMRAGAGMPAILSVTQFARGETKVSVLLPEPADAEDPDTWKREVRYVPYDASSGLYAAGEGEEAGEQAEFTGWADGGSVYTVRLKEPGKYLLSGVPFYLMDPADERLSALYSELAFDVQSMEGKTQQELAKKVHDWLVKRVRSVIPDDREDLKEACLDPMNCLLTGYARAEAYAPLYQLLLGSVRIDAVTVTGTVKEEAHCWTLACLDGAWSFTDAAMDDEKDKAGKKYFALSREQMDKDHVLSGPSDAFLRKYVNASVLDAFLAGDEALEERVRYSSTNEGASLYGVVIEGKCWSVGPSEPVTLHVFRTREQDEIFRKQWEENLRHVSAQQLIRVDILGGHFAWQPEYGSYDHVLNELQFNEEGDVEVVSWSDDLSTVTVRFLTPGKYTLNSDDGTCFYVFDPQVEKLAQAGADLDAALESCRGETQRETAKKLQDWVASRVRYDYDTYRTLLRHEEDYNGLSTSQDPVRTLLTGSTMCGGYATIYAMLMKSAGIPCYYITGWAKHQQNVRHAWNVARLDGTWCYIDPCWCDTGGGSSTKWFGLTYEKMSRDHIADNTLLDDLIRAGVYDNLLQRFHSAYTPRGALPAMLSPLPATAAACGFPKKPDFFRFGLDTSEKEYSVNVGAKVQYVYAEWMSVTGEHNWNLSRGAERWNHWPMDLDVVTTSRYILRLKLYDYDPDKPFLKGTRKDQTLIASQGRIDCEAYCLHEVINNTIPGWPEGTRTWTWDAEGRPYSVSWKLSNDRENLEVAAYFDQDGNTCAWALSRSAARGFATRWKMTPEGELLEFRSEYEGGVLTLRDRTDDWLWNSSSGFRDLLKNRYPQLNPEEALPEGVRLWSLSKEDGLLFSGSAAYAADMPLVRWNEEGILELNPDAVDINGNPVSLLRSAPDLASDLAVCEKLTVR